MPRKLAKEMWKYLWDRPIKNQWVTFWHEESDLYFHAMERSWGQSGFVSKLMTTHMWEIKSDFFGSCDRFDMIRFSNFFSYFLAFIIHFFTKHRLTVATLFGSDIFGHVSLWTDWNLLLWFWGQDFAQPLWIVKNHVLRWYTINIFLKSGDKMS